MNRPPIRAALVAALYILALAAAGAATVGVATSWWAFDLAAFLAPPIRIALIVGEALVAILLIAWLRPWQPGRAPLASTEDRPIEIPIALALLATCVLLPDRSAFMGDYILRLGALQTGIYLTSFPQSLVLDRVINGGWVPLLATSLHVSPAEISRLGGIFAYAVLIAVLFAARRDRTTGMASWVALLLLGGSGLAGMFTGFPRETVLFLPLCLALLLTLRQRVSAERALSPLPECLLLLMVYLHRSALFLVLPYVVATGIALRERPRDQRLPVPWAAGAVALALGALIAVPTYFRIFVGFDLPRHADWTQHLRLTALPVLDWRHWFDLANVLWLWAPGSLLVLLPSRDRDRRHAWFEGSLLVCWMPLALLIRPQQGMFRDYDVYSALALTLVVVGCWRLARFAPGFPRLSANLAALAVLLSTQGMLALLLVANSPAATESRVAAAVTGRTSATNVERAQWLDYLGITALSRRDSVEAARWFHEAADLVPTEVRDIRAGLALNVRAQFAESRVHFERIVGRDSTNVLGWSGVACTSLRLADSLRSRQALGALVVLCRNPARMAETMRFLSQAPHLDPDSAVRSRLRVDR